MVSGIQLQIDRDMFLAVFLYDVVRMTCVLN